MLKTIFFGTPAAAVPFLERLAVKSQVIGVVTSPDKPAGRGHDLKAPPVKEAALALHLPCLQPPVLRNPGVLSDLEKWGPADLGVVVAYGRLIPRDLFSWPRLGLVNVHFSMLPQYRGAAPVQRALMDGQSKTGVTLFQIVEALDAGPLYLQREEPIREDDTSGALRARLSERGLELLDELLAGLEQGSLKSRPQEGAVTLAPPLKKEEGRIRWDRQEARTIVNLVRGTYEWPGSYFLWKGKSLKVRGTVRAMALETTGRPGALRSFERDGGFLVECAKDALLVARLQPEGKKEMSALDFANGARLMEGDVFE